jgi:hypothetical protein
VRTSNSGTSAEGAGDGANATATLEGEETGCPSSVSTCTLEGAAGAPDAGAAVVVLDVQLRQQPMARQQPIAGSDQAEQWWRREKDAFLGADLDQQRFVWVGGR